MMNSLFSSFDPMSSTMKLNYTVMMVCFAFPLMNMKMILSNRTQKMQTNMNWLMSNEIKASIMNENNKGKVSMMTSIFFLMLTLNLMGLSPYVFTLTAHLAFTLALALPFWLGFILFSASKNTNSFLAHLVPLSTPMALSHFMSIIETVSQLIRPITLSVRMAANMTAGHILMALVSAPIMMMNLMTLVLTMLFLLEIAVAFIQSYVFTLLLAMYLSETN